MRRVRGCAVLFAIAAVTTPGLLTQARRPNLVLITLDTVRADRLGSYGYTLAATPALDRLAREGVRFADATTSAPLTGPAHAAILTGVYPARYGVRDNAATPLPPEATTLAEILKRAGYRTGAFIGAFVLDRTYGFDQGFETFDSRFEQFSAGSKLNVERPAGDVVRPALAWLADAAASQPFFVWIHFYDAHDPYRPPPPFQKTFANRLYDGEIAYVDTAVAQLVARLEQRGLLDDTLIVAIGDHGESLGEHGEDTHGLFLYEAVLRVPWISRLPRRERAGTVVTEQVRTVDLVPTVLEWLGVPAPPGLDGESLAGVVGGTSRPSPPAAYAETFFPRFHYGWSESLSIRVGEWKFIDAPRPELYDLRKDRAERFNLVERQATVAGQLSHELQQLVARLGSPAAVQPPAPDAETLARLRSLGYIGFAAGTSSTTRGPDTKDQLDAFRRFGRLVEAGTDALRRRQYEAALDLLKQALAINPHAYDVHLLLGDAYQNLRRYDQAVGEYDAAILLNPTSVDPLLAAAAVLTVQGHLDEAARRIDRAATLEPASAEVAFARGRVSERAGRHEDAFAYFEQAVQMNPSDPRPRASLANVAGRLKRYDVARREMMALLQMGYQPARTHYALGRVAEDVGDRETAIKEYREAIRLDPSLTEAREALVRLTAKRTRAEATDRQRPSGHLEGEV